MLQQQPKNLELSGGYNIEAYLPEALKHNPNLTHVFSKKLHDAIVADPESLTRDLEPIDDKAFEQLMQEVMRESSCTNHPYHRYSGHFLELAAFTKFLIEALKLPKAEAQLLTYIPFSHDYGHSGTRYRQKFFNNSCDQRSKEDSNYKSDQILSKPQYAVPVLFRLLSSGIILSSAVMQLNPDKDATAGLKNIARPYIPITKLELIFSLIDISKGLVWANSNPLQGSLDFLLERKNEWTEKDRNWKDWLKGEDYFASEFLAGKIKAIKQFLPQKIYAEFMERVKKIKEFIAQASQFDPNEGVASFSEEEHGANPASLVHAAFTRIVS